MHAQKIRARSEYQMPRDLMGEILVKKPNIKRSGLEVTLSRTKRRLDLKSIEQAACFYIKKNNLDINVSSIIDDVTRRAVQNELVLGKPTNLSPVRRKPPKSLPKSDDPFIDNQMFNAANNNAEIYPVVYLFENSVRNFVVAVMKKNYGNDWWTEKVEKVNTRIRDNVNIRRLAEKESPWHSKRGADPIYYTDIEDLEKIINTYSKDFRKILKGKFEHVIVWIDEIEKTRNILAHNNLVAKKDRERLTVFARDWGEFARLIAEIMK